MKPYFNLIVLTKAKMEVHFVEATLPFELASTSLLERSVYEVLQKRRGMFFQ